MNSRTKVRAAAVISLLGLGCATQANADTSAGSLAFLLDNDIFTGSDKHYTNGFGLTWVSPDVETYDEDRFISKWARFWSFLPFVSDEGYTTYASWSLAQEMYTPDNIQDPNPPETDQPYAGVLYIDSTLYARNERWMHAWELKLGVVGPASQAASVQRDVHRWIGADQPQGWHTQLPSEPVVNIGYTVAHLAAQGKANTSAQWRIVPMATVGVGNYFTGVGAGVYGEFGWNLVDSLGATALRSGLNAASTVGVGPVQGWSVAFFAGVAGYGVAHYLPLDGTVFRHSRSVDSEPAVGMASLGCTVRHGTFTLNLATSYFTDTFKEQRRGSSFGTVSMSWNL